MKEVYVVFALDTYAEYADEDFIAGIFSTREKAEYYVEHDAAVDLGGGVEVTEIVKYPVL